MDLVGGAESDPRKNVHDIAARDDHDGVLIFTDFVVRLIREKGRRHQDAECCEPGRSSKVTGPAFMTRTLAQRPQHRLRSGERERSSIGIGQGRPSCRRCR